MVLSDIRMPRMDGMTLVRRAREEGIPALFVMMTAFASIETAVEAMRAGAENFLVKPLDAEHRPGGPRQGAGEAAPGP